MRRTCNVELCDTSEVVHTPAVAASGEHEPVAMDTVTSLQVDHQVTAVADNTNQRSTAYSSFQLFSTLGSFFYCVTLEKVENSNVVWMKTLNFSFVQFLRVHCVVVKTVILFK